MGCNLFATTLMENRVHNTESPPLSDPDASLVREVQGGNVVAFTELYNKYSDKIYGFCYRNIGNQQEAEDLAQDVFVETYRAIFGFEFRSQFRTWLYQVARYHIMDYWRKMYKSKTLSLEDFLYLDLASKETEVEEGEVEKKELMVTQILDLLPVHYRKVLELRFLKNYSLKDTAAELNTTVGNVKVMQYRALKKAVAVSDQL